MVIDEKLRWYGFWLVDRLQEERYAAIMKKSVTAIKTGLP